MAFFPHHEPTQRYTRTWQQDKILNAHGKRSTKNVFPYLWTREDIKIEFGLQIQFEIEGKKS